MQKTLGGHGASHEQLLWLAVVCVFCAAALALTVLYRRVTRAVQLERAEALLAEEFERLDDDAFADERSVITRNQAGVD